jgi:hypothetical protein
MSHRSTTYPCFLPDLGEFSRSWSHKTYPAAKVIKIFRVPSSRFKYFKTRNMEPGTWNLEPGTRNN